MFNLNNLKVVLFVCIVFECLITFNQVDCLSNFIRGRRFLKHTNLNLKLSNITDQYYDQRLDHFNEANRKTWKQVSESNAYSINTFFHSINKFNKQKRYWENDQYFDKRNGPVFLMIGGEGEEDPIWMTHGSWISYAQKFVNLSF